MATAPKGNNMGYDPEATMLSLSNNQKKALKNSYNAALRRYVELRVRNNPKYTTEVLAASKLVKNALNVMEMKGMKLNDEQLRMKKIHNKLSTRKANLGGGKRKSRKASRRRLTRRRR